MYWIIFIGFMILSFIVSSTLKRKFKKYSQVPIANGMSGAEAAMNMLRDYGIYDVDVVSVPGRLTDHYHPMKKTVNLSEDVYYGRHAAAVAVAAHECGHAVQHASAYKWLGFRSALVPVQNASSSILNVIFLLGFFGAFVFQAFPIQLVLTIIVLCYLGLATFSLVTLPVEMDASKRALAWIKDRNVAQGKDYTMAADALKWAGRTYIVAALSSVAMLAYWVMQLMASRD
jgi:Zn-dependent membrane protease YugP